MKHIDIPNTLRSYRFLGEEAESLGKRLDAARDALAAAKSEWAKRHWQNTVNQLLVQWRALPALHDGDAQMTIIPRWTIDYNYYSRDDGIGYTITDKVFDKVFRTNLDESWERARAARLARCQ